MSFANLFSSYSKRVGIVPGSLYFHHQGGKLIKRYDTALSLGLRDSDEILTTLNVPIRISFRLIIGDHAEAVPFIVHKNMRMAKVLRTLAIMKAVNVSHLKCCTSACVSVTAYDTPLTLGLKNGSVLYCISKSSE